MRAGRRTITTSIANHHHGLFLEEAGSVRAFIWTISGLRTLVVDYYIATITSLFQVSVSYYTTTILLV
jgi:hypothetical protein